MLFRSGYTADDIAGLASLPLLDTFLAYGGSFSDAAVEGLLAVPTLDSVNFNKVSWAGNVAVTDTGLGVLARHKNISHITLANVHLITDTGLLKLSAMPQLKRLDVKSGGCPKITDAGIEAFKKARPDVNVTR